MIIGKFALLGNSLCDIITLIMGYSAHRQIDMHLKHRKDIYN